MPHFDDANDAVGWSPADDPIGFGSLMSWLQNPNLHNCPACSQAINAPDPGVVVVVHAACGPTAEKRLRGVP